MHNQFETIPPDGEGEGEPDGDGVDDDGEVDVEPHEDAPHVGELVLKWSRFLDQENEVNAQKII